MLGTPVTITPPADVLISTDEAKSYLRLDGAEMDPEARLLADAAAADVEARTSLRLLNQQVSITADSFVELEWLNVGPVREIASIAYRDSAGEAQNVPAEDYELFGAPLEQGVRLTHGARWPAAASAIAATFDVGFGTTAADAPAPLRLAAFALLRGRYEEREVNIDPLIVNYRIWLA